ncbi:MAG: hypothetical protein A2020_06465 [Lentisphaerae bacterium GWF2_45_14]|nr:MAG: hypothetical protein A2020_06465 [Lentisphaerae bacterium GWF2_45_14]
MIQSIGKAVKILRFAAESKSGIRLCELSRACEMSRNTVYNLAETLVQEGLLAKTAESRYIIGETIGELAGKSTGRLEKAEKILRRLHLKYPDSHIFYSELGASDVIVRFHYTPGRPGIAVYPDTMTLPLYLTVGGLVFLAFAPDEKLVALRMKNPFEYHGLQAWGTMGKFADGLESARKKGYAETPGIVPETTFKVGMPVWDKSGMIASAITFDLKNFEKSKRKETLGDVSKTASEIGNIVYI